MTFLKNGQKFPIIEVPAIGGGTLKLPEALAGAYGVVLIYRGSWCPYCNAQLAAFGRAASKLTEVGIKVAAFSADDEPTTSTLAAKHNLPFAMGHSANVAMIAAATGAYTNDTGTYFQTTGFVLAPDGTVLNAVYSSAAIGRLAADDVLGFVAYRKSQAQAA